MRLRLDLAYDGTAFSGWARQPGLRTVQGELEHALQLILHAGSDRELRVTVAGRTDAGVHARHQVCHVDVEPHILDCAIGHLNLDGVHSLEYRLRHILPDDIALHSVIQAPQGFDARFSALDMTYVYRICDDATAQDPRLRLFVLRLDDHLDIAAMNEAAELMVGLHDFGSFATASPHGTTIREVKHARWSRTQPQRSQTTSVAEVDGLGSGLVTFTIVADAFAHNMVRSLVNACIQIGRHRRSVAWFQDKLDHPEREGDTGPIAAHGLSLEYVAYPSDAELAFRANTIRAKRKLES